MKKPNLFFAIYGLLWTAFNSLTLGWFPYVHSDEAWLGGLSQAYLTSQTISVTEPFFDLLPRQPHAFKVLYHLMEAGLIKLLGMQVTSVRFLSVVAAVVVLIALYVGLTRSLQNRWLSLGVTIVFSLQPIFLTSAHLARQEMLILAVLAIASLWFRTQFFTVGLWLGFGALIHPNALIGAAMIGVIVFKDWLIGTTKLNDLIRMIGGLFLAGVALILFSLKLSPNFIVNYAQFGISLNVDAAPIQRWQNFLAYFNYIWQPGNGTYWLPAMQIWLVLALVLTFMAAGILLLNHLGYMNWKLENRRGLVDGLLQIMAFLVTIFVIGRYNPTSILFILWPLGQLLAHLGTGFYRKIGVERPMPSLVYPLFDKSLARLGTPIVLIALIISSAVSSWAMIEPFLPVDRSMLWARKSADNPFVTYNDELAASLPEHAIVLGNLSAGFMLTERAQQFLDIRNLPFAADASLAGYLKAHQINVVIWYEEYDFILNNPAWWVLYETRPGRTADPSALAALKVILDNHGQLINTIESPIYGTRVVSFQNNQPWSVSLYALDWAAIS
ncbi:MAG: hypothetical protein PHC86_05525 [Eubacteriales bacterium]|nr:hypothetical protein [Eubacteriales bacterium]